MTWLAWHPADLMRLIFALLVVVLVIVGAITRVRPRTAREWTLVWMLLVFLAWALVGFGWLRSV